ncbi:isoprenylcysteine carboxylmethyltransferase family protein [Plantibacter flavus]|uniref:methyltransferase family protein n=1 Tax=Plantibacter flavus TaxID=150123 RepID=UPI003F159814
MRWARGYFAAQAAAGAAWWIGVALSPVIRVATLGGLDAPLVAAFDLPLFVGASAMAAFGSRAAAIVTTAWTSLVALAMGLYATVTVEAGWGALIMIAAAGASIVALLVVLTGGLPRHWLLIGPFRFRPTPPGRALKAVLRRTALQIVVFWLVFLAVLPLVISAVERRWQLAVDVPAWTWPVGLVLFIVAAALGLWSSVTMSLLGGGTPLPSSMPNELVVAGPYRFVRNPMAVAGIAQGVAVGVMLSSWLVVAYAIIGSFVWNAAIRPLEESDLAARFGESFERYRRTVRCWWPRLPRETSTTP